MKNRFPMYSLDPRHSAPLRNRWAVFARWSVLRSLKNWQARLSSEADSTFNIVTLLKLQDADMFVAAMRSLSLVRRTLPPVFVVCDREEDIAKLEMKLDRHLVGVVVIGPRQVRRDLINVGQEVLAELTKKQVYWLKFAAVIIASQSRDTLFSDSDILYFHDPEKLSGTGGKRPCHIAQDCKFSYSSWLIETLLIQRGIDLRSNRPGNAGFGIYPHGFAEAIDHEMLQRCAERPDAEIYDEQTFTAYTVLTRGEVLQKNDIYVDIEPITAWRGSWRGCPWLGRHYVGPIRDQFWIDAWQLLVMDLAFR